MTDRGTDRRTDILPRHSPRYAYASRGKNAAYPHNRSALELISKQAFKVFFFDHTGLKSLTPFIKSTVRNALQRAWIKHCLRSATSLIHSILHHAPYSVGLRSGLFGSHKSRGMNVGVERCVSSIVWWAHMLTHCLAGLLEEKFS